MKLLPDYKANFIYYVRIWKINMTWYLEVENKSILEAIKEFDSSGRDNFLKKYKFRHARSYFILHNNKQYDCKPIMLAAYEHQFGKLPFLSRGSNGVNKTIRPKLEKMGFSVISTERAFEDDLLVRSK